MTELQDLVSKPAAIKREPPGKIEGRIAEAANIEPPLTQLKAFCSQASVVGLRYVANPSASVFRRSVWVLLLLAGAAFTTYQILDRTMYYFSYETNINIRVEHVPEMRFPTVTFCNENMYTKSEADSLGKLSPVHFVEHCRFTLKKLSCVMKF